jgi:hypothetical protein
MAGTWQTLTQPPSFAASTMLLLTDGMVLCQEAGGKNWWRLTPDTTGNYVNGTWSPLAAMHHTRLYYASAVLADGRVFVAGGEYSDGGAETNTAEIYDPLTNTWTEISAPTGWQYIGDAPCCVLPDGNVLLGQIEDTRTAIYDPNTNTWTAGPNKDERSAEESWALLADDTVLVVECTNHPKAEKYVAALNRWVSAGTVPVELVEASSSEIGPSLRLPDGQALFIGATGKTALYQPPVQPADPEAWTVGPSFPAVNNQTLGAKDAPACLLPNGKVLCVAGPVDGVSGDYLGPTYCFEFDGQSLTRVPDAPILQPSTVPYDGRMLMLPSGQVLFAVGTPGIAVYTPDGRPDPCWRPIITQFPLLVRPQHTYTLFGQQLNGLSQASVYGDDASMATNYPLVCIRNPRSGKVVYCRTSDHSSMGIGTGTAVHSTQVLVPRNIEHGQSEIAVIANGIPSDWRHVRVLRPMAMAAAPAALTVPHGKRVIVPMLGQSAAPPAGSPPHLSFGGGHLLTSVQVYTIFWGAAWQQPAQSSLIPQLNAFFDTVLTSSLMDMLAEYSDSATGQTIGHGQRIGTATRTDSEPGGGSGQVSDAQIQQALQGWMASGAVPSANANTLYFVYIPPNVTVLDPQGDQSCQQLCGYHWFIAGTSPEVYYAVMPFPGCPGCLGTLTVIQALTSTSSHELCEAITDAHPWTGWNDNANGEIGDICAWQTDTINGYTVQKEWSNSQGACVIRPSP